MKQKITKNLETLKENDIISFLLYCVYRLSNDPEYSIISELIYTMDKDSLYKLCATYGGCTIKIPKLDELNAIVQALLLGQQFVEYGNDFDTACEFLKIDQADKRKYIKLYNAIVGYYDEYEQTK